MMKKIFLLVTFFVLGKMWSYAQYPITQNIGSDSTIVVSKGALQSRLINVTYPDTATANLQRIRQYPGAQIATTSGGINLWVRNTTATAWLPINTGSGNNIYTIDGTLTGNRTLTGNNYSLTFTGLSQFLLTVGNQTFTVRSDSASLTRKLSYASNRGSTFTLYSLVDKNYVDSAIASSPAGTVTQINTNNNTGITGGPITSTGTLAIDTLLISTRAWRQKGVDSLQANINLKLNIVDTTGMLANYVNSVGYGLGKTSQTVYVDSASLSNYYLRRKDSLTATNPLGYVTQKILADTAAAIRSSDLGGTVTSVATNNGTGITGGTITTSGTLAIDTTIISTRAWRQKGVDSLQANINLKLNISDTASMLNPYLRKVDTASLSNRINQKLNISDTASMLSPYLRSNTAAATYVPQTRTLTINGTTQDLSANRTYNVGTVTSVGLTMPAAFNVANSPVTGSGTLAVTGAGLASQYIRGDGTLANFPGGGGGGGASVSYYLNGSVNQGTFGGNTYYQMNKTPILGAGTNFTTNTNGYIAQFITNAGDPALLNIPAGNWNFELFFSASSGGGTPSYYVELYKYDGTTFTLIASGSSNPDVIVNSAVDAYFSALPVPQTTLTLTDRLAVRIYVTHAGRTITLHTEDNNLCQVVTTFTTGITAINSLTAQVQYLTTGTSGTDFNISSLTDTHTFNLPVASGTNTGKLSNTDWTTFNNKVGGSLVNGYITKATGTNTIDTSQLFQSNGLIGIGTTSPTQKLQVSGNAYVNGQLFAGDTALSVYQVEGILNTPYVLGRKAVNNTLSTEARPTGVMGHVVGRGSIANRLQAANFYTTTDSASTANSTGSLRSVNAWTAHNGSGSLATAWGSYNIVQNKTTGTITNAYGSVSGVENRGATSTINKLHGTTTEIWNNYGGTIDTAFGQVISIYNNNAASNIGAVYGLSIGKGLITPTGGTHYWRNSGTIGTSYGLYLDSSIDVGTTKYALFSNSNSDSYLRGNLGLGTTTPGGRLAIVDTGGFALKINYNSASTDANNNAALYAENNGLSSYVAILNEKTTNNTGGQYPILIESSLTSGTAQSGMATGIHFGVPDDAGNRKVTQLALRTTDPAAATYTNRAELRLWNNGSLSTPYYLLGNGNMGLGTATPDSNLTVVNGALFQRGVRMSGLPSAPGTKALRINASGTISIADTLIDAGGTVTSVATNNGTGITGGTITTSGTLAIDTLLISTRAWRQKGVDSVAALANTKVSGSLISGYIPKATGTLTVDTSQIYQNNGNIGIGTISPASGFKVDMTGSLRVGNGSSYNNITINGNSGAGSYLRFQKNGTNKGDIGPYSAVLGGVPPYSGSNDDLTYSSVGGHFFNTNAGIKMYLTNAGNLGLSASPDSMLTVLEGAYFQRGVRMSGLPSAPGTRALRINANGTLSVADTLVDAGGTVTSVATNNGTGITGGTITTTGTLAIDTLLISTRAWRQKGVDSLQANINQKLNISDTASMLSPYLRTNVAAATYVPQTRTITINGTSQDLSANRTYNVGTVTSVATNTGTGITGGTITSSGTIAADTLLLSTRAWRQKGIDSVAALINSNVSGTTNYVAKFTGTNTIGNSQLFDNGTNVGIGTTSPGSKLQVNSVAGNYGIVNTNGTVSVGTYIEASNSYASFGTQSNHPLGFFTNNNAPQMYITTAGNVGIGTTSPENAAGYATITINGSSGGQITFATSNSKKGYLYNNATNMYIGSESGALIFDAGAIEAMRITSSRNLLVGTTTDAGYKLDVSGSARVNNTTQFIFNTSNLQIATSGVSAFYANSSINWSSSSTFTLQRQSGLVGLHINGSDNVGIGTTSPATLLSISGSTPTLTINRVAAGNQGKLSFTDQGTEYAYIQPSAATGIMRYDVGPSAAWGGIHAFFTDQSERMRISSNGAIRFNAYGSGSFTGTRAYDLSVDASGNIIEVPIGAGTITGSGTANYIPKFTSSSAIGNSVIYESGGDIGIGTTTLGGKFQVKIGTDLNIAFNSTGGIARISAFNDAISASIPLIINGDNLRFTTGGSERMRLDASGNLGLGVSPSAWGSGYRVIEGAYGGNFGFDLNIPISRTVSNGINNGTNWVYKINAPATLYDVDGWNGQFRWYTAPSGTAGNVISFTQAMTLFSTGNLAVGGTSDNGSRLNVTGAGYFSGNLTSSGIASLGIGETTNLAYIGDRTTVNTRYIKFNRASALTDIVNIQGVNGGVGAANIALQAEGGNVGIGTTSPNNRLSIFSGTGSSSFISSAANNNVEGTSDVVIGQNSDDGGYFWNRKSSFLSLGTANTERMRITSGGNVGIGTTSPAAKLDIGGATVGAVQAIFGRGNDDNNFTVRYTNGTSGTNNAVQGTIGLDYANGVWADMAAIKFIRNSTAGELSFFTSSSAASGTEKMRLTSAGRLGIGTSSPSYPLDVVGYMRTSIGLIGNGGLTLYGDAGSATGMFLTASGNLGLGVTPSAWGTSPISTKAFQVGNVSSFVDIGISYGTFIGHNWAYLQSGGDRYIENGFATYYKQLNGTHAWFNSPSGTAGNAISWTQAMTLDASGRLGIGITSPNSPLHIYGNGDQYITIQSANTASSQSAFTRYIRSTTGSARTWWTGVGIQGGTDDSYSFYDQTAGAERMRITSGGNLLLATTTDNGARLNINGYAAVSNNNAWCGVPTTGGFTALIGLDNNNKTQLGTTTNGSVMTLTGNNVGIGTTSPATTLDVSYTAAAGDIIHIAGANNVNGYIGAHALNNGGLYINSNQANQDLRFRTQGTDRAIIDASGNLGLGVTPSAWNTAYRAIQFGTTGAIFGESGDAANYFSSNSFIDATGWKYTTTDFASMYSQVNGQHYWLIAPSGSSGTTISWTQAMTLDASGRLGIGTTSPLYKLDVQGTSGTVAIRAASNTAGDILFYGTGTVTGSIQLFDDGINATTAVGGNIANQNSSTGSAYMNVQVPSASSGNPRYILTTSGATNWSMGIKNSDSDKLYIGATDDPSNGSPVMTMTTGGLVGIGTTSPTGYTGANLVLHLNTSSTITDLKLTNGTTGTAALAGGLLRQDGRSMYLWNVENNFLSFGTNNSEQMRIASTGNVLVGSTTDGGFKLYVNGTTKSQSTLYLGGNTDMIDPSSNSGFMTIGSNQPIRFTNASTTEYMRITTSGVVGIGTSSPDASVKLQVESSSSSSVRIVSSAASGGDLYITSVNGGSESRIDKQGTAGPLTFYNNGSERMRLTSGGELLINTTTDAGAYPLQVNGSVYATAYYESSDLRLKNVLSERQGSDGINTITFKWKDGRDSLTHIGYAAQQVEKVLPDAVKTNTDGYKTINYDEVQSLKIANLEQEIAELKKIIKQLIDKK